MPECYPGRDTSALAPILQHILRRWGSLAHLTSDGSLTGAGCGVTGILKLPSSIRSFMSVWDCLEDSSASSNPKQPLNLTVSKAQGGVVNNLLTLRQILKNTTSVSA